MIQIELPLFKTEKIDKAFDFNFNGIDGRSCYTRRENGETFLYISEFNFVGQNSMTLFRFLDSSVKGYENVHDVINPDLNKLSKSRIIEFANSVIRRHLAGEFNWSHEKRSQIYTKSLVVSN
jgi:hypothetical protein